MVTLKGTAATTRWIAGALAAIIIGVSAPANAGVANAKTIKVINVNFNNATPQLAVLLSDNIAYVANVVGGNECGTIPSPSFDMVKLWQSQLSAALLSGKTVNVNFSDCNGFHWITEVDLLP